MFYKLMTAHIVITIPECIPSHVSRMLLHYTSKKSWSNKTTVTVVSQIQVLGASHLHTINKLLHHINITIRPYCTGKVITACRAY